MESFDSVFEHAGRVSLPQFSGKRVMMMPFVLGDPSSLPDDLDEYRSSLMDVCALRPQHTGEVGYVTIDEKILHGAPHRRGGLHVDGVYRGGAGGWGGGGWGSVSTGMLTVASAPGCVAWNQSFEGWPGDEGDCEHLRQQLKSEGTLFQPNEVYWLSGLCVHESIAPRMQGMYRQFVRVSLPSTAPWFEGYSVNPRGILPTGPILPRRSFLDQ
jgi:hypothetical protein